MGRWSFIACFYSMLGFAAGAEGPSSLTSWPREAQGYGLTVEDAKNDAIKNILEQLTAALADHRPALTSWQPTSDYVKSHLLDDGGRQGEDFVVEKLSTKRWIQPVRSLDWDTLVALDQQTLRTLRSKERAQWGLGIAAAYVLVLSGVIIKKRRAKP